MTNVGYLLLTDCWSKGIMTEAVPEKTAPFPLYAAIRGITHR